MKHNSTVVHCYQEKNGNLVFVVFIFYLIWLCNRRPEILLLLKVVSREKKKRKGLFLYLNRYLSVFDHILLYVNLRYMNIKYYYYYYYYYCYYYYYYYYYYYRCCRYTGSEDEYLFPRGRNPTFAFNAIKRSRPESTTITDK